MNDLKKSKQRENGSPLLDLVFGSGENLNLDHLPGPSGPSSKEPLKESALQEAAFQQGREDRKYMKISVCVALYAVLGIIWFPGSHKVIILPEHFEEAHKPTRRKIRTTVPPKPVRRVNVSKPTARRVPMPDYTPDEPEPRITEVSLPEPDLVSTDEWDVELPGDGAAEMQSRGGHVFRRGHDGVTAPIITHRASPMYPVEAVKIKLQGYVILEAILRKDGRIDNIKVLQKMAGGKYGFEREAIAALKKWEFTPGTHYGKPADIRMTLKISFVIY